jgi:hypothetical protein
LSLIRKKKFDPDPHRSDEVKSRIRIRIKVK